MAPDRTVFGDRQGEARSRASMKDAWAEMATTKLPRPQRALFRGEEVEEAKCFRCSGDRGWRRIAPIAAWVALCAGGMPNLGACRLRCTP
eukprot:1467141-Pyramimonas_sp.AAC.1